MKISTKWLSIIGILLLALIFSRIDMQGVLLAISKANFLIIALGVLTAIIDVLLMGKKWQMIVNKFHKFSFRDSLKNYLIGTAFGTATPGRVGDFIKLFDLNKKTGLGKKSCFSIIFFDRLADLAILCGSAFFGLILANFFFFKSNTMVLLFIILMFFAVSGIFFIFSLFFIDRKYLSYFVKITSFFVPHKIFQKGKDFFIKMREIFKKIKINLSLAAYLAISFIAWQLAFFRPYIFALSIGLNFPPLFFILVIPAVTFVEILPISLFGVGTRDIALILFFAPMGATPEQMVAVSALVLFFGNLPQTIAGFYFAWKEKLKVHFE